VLSVLAGAAVASGIAYATIPGSDGVIHACYSANGTGALNVYDPSNTDGSVPTSCIKGQASFAFNQQGPAGPPGPQGPAGHLAPAAVTAIEQNLALPATASNDSSETRFSDCGDVSQRRRQSRKR
jgi:hypothetical protein